MERELSTADIGAALKCPEESDAAYNSHTCLDGEERAEQEKGRLCMLMVRAGSQVCAAPEENRGLWTREDYTVFRGRGASYLMLSRRGKS